MEPWIWVIIVVVAVVAVLGFFEWRSWNKPLSRRLQGHGHNPGKGHTGAI